MHEELARVAVQCQARLSCVHMVGPCDQCFHDWYRDVCYRGFWFSTWLDSKPPAERQATIDKTLKFMAEGLLAPPIGAWGALAAGSLKATAEMFPLLLWRCVLTCAPPVTAAACCDVTGKVFPLSEFAAAVRESQVVGRLGKVLLKCS
jgi:hypothetical protein